MFDPQALQELRKLNEKRGLFLSDEELLDMAESLLGLVEAVYRPIRQEWVDEIEAKDTSAK